MSMLRQPTRLVQSTARLVASRSFSASLVSRKDLIQDMYVSELKSYKAPPAAKDAHVGAVKSYSAPSPPKAPAAPTDLASELSAYDATEPTLSSSGPPKTGTDEVGTGAQAFLSFLEQDLPKPEVHHH